MKDDLIGRLRKMAQRIGLLLSDPPKVPEVAAITGQSYQMVQHYAAGISQRRMGKAAILKLENNRTKRDKSA